MDQYHYKGFYLKCKDCIHFEFKKGFYYNWCTKLLRWYPREQWWRGLVGEGGCSSYCTKDNVYMPGYARVDEEVLKRCRECIHFEFADGYFYSRCKRKEEHVLSNGFLLHDCPSFEEDDRSEERILRRNW